MRTLPALAALALACGLAAAWALPVVQPQPGTATPTQVNGAPMPSLQPQDLSGQWEVIELTGAALVPGQPPTISFGAGSVTGFAGCNQYSTTIGLQDGNLVFSPLGMTRMACGEAEMAVEIAMIRAFQRINAATLEADGTLALTGYGLPMLRARRAE
jgi:heat shock protein HslJ